MLILVMDKSQFVRLEIMGMILALTDQYCQAVSNYNKLQEFSDQIQQIPIFSHDQEKHLNKRVTAGKTLENLQQKKTLRYHHHLLIAD